MNTVDTSILEEIRAKIKSLSVGFQKNTRKGKKQLIVP